MESLLQLLNNIRPISRELAIHLQSTLKKHTCKKGEILQSPGQEVFLYFIQSGLLKAFRYENSKEVCTWFQHEGNAVMSLAGWYKRVPADEYIIALEDTVVYYLSRQDLDQVYAKFIEFNVHGRVLTETYYLMIWEWFDLVRTKKAHERYAYFVENFGEWVQRVPSKDIASFLGLSRAHFSYAKKRGGSLFEIETVFMVCGLLFDVWLLTSFTTSKSVCQH